MHKKFLLVFMAAFGLSSSVLAQSPAGSVATPEGVAVIKEVDRTKYHKHITEAVVPNYVWDGQVRLGVVLPPNGPAYSTFPDDYKVPHYRYAKVNDKLVIVNTATRQIVDIVN